MRRVQFSLLALTVTALFLSFGVYGLWQIGDDIVSQSLPNPNYLENSWQVIAALFRDHPWLMAWYIVLVLAEMRLVVWLIEWHHRASRKTP